MPQVSRSGGGDTMVATATLRGAGFVSGASVRLRHTGDPDIVGSGIAVAADGHTITVSFDLRGRPLMI